MTGRTLDRVPTRRADGSARASFTDLDCVSDLLCAADTRSGSDSASASCFERGTDPSCLSCALARKHGFRKRGVYTAAVSVAGGQGCPVACDQC